MPHSVLSIVKEGLTAVIFPPATNILAGIVMLFLTPFKLKFPVTLWVTAGTPETGSTFIILKEPVGNCATSKKSLAFKCHSNFSFPSSTFRSVQVIEVISIVKAPVAIFPSTVRPNLPIAILIVP